MYKIGFATTQEAYAAAVPVVFDGLDRLEKILTGKDYLVGDRLTEADVWLFVTIVRPSSPVSLPVNIELMCVCSGRFNLIRSTTASSRPTSATSATATPRSTSGCASSTGTMPCSRKRPTLTT